MGRRAGGAEDRHRGARCVPPCGSLHGSGSVCACRHSGARSIPGRPPQACPRPPGARPSRPGAQHATLACKRPPAPSLHLPPPAKVGHAPGEEHHQLIAVVDQGELDQVHGAGGAHADRPREHARGHLRRGGAMRGRVGLNALRSLDRDMQHLRMPRPTCPRGLCKNRSGMFLSMIAADVGRRWGFGDVPVELASSWAELLHPIPGRLRSR